ncbi:ABC transporter substrate-binding protein [Candidatus Fermentibacteria bacterium]|nr:ABC transporter substrate-binding protein [Candidatus Fermentibacteria bacterium]
MIRFRLAAAAFLLAAACGGPSGGREGVVRVGFFPNITHSQALIGLARGDFQEALGDGVRIEAVQFNAGPSVIEAIFAGELDIAYIGPNPAITGYVRSGGEALRIVSGATSGGAALVVRPGLGLRSAADLAGRRIATPQLGNTQDVALRQYLAAAGLEPVENGGDVEVVPTENPQILDLFKQGEIDGAWVPEPWASRLILEGGGELFVDERDMWPGGDFVTACVIVSTPFLERHPEIVKAWLGAHVEVTLWERENPGEASALLNSEIERLTGKAMPEAVISMALDRMTPTWDPVQSSLRASAEAAWRCGFLDTEPDLSGICDLSLLEEVLEEKGLQPLEQSVEP